MGISKRNKRLFICINTKLFCNLYLLFTMCITLWSKVGIQLSICNAWLFICIKTKGKIWNRLDTG